MSLLSVIGDVAGNVLSGGVTSLIGIGLKSFAEYKNKKLDYEQALSLKEADSKIMQMEWAGRDKVAATEAAAAADVAASQAFARSYDLEPKRYLEGVKVPQGWLGKQVLAPLVYALLGILDFAKGLVRPGMSYYLCGLTTIMYFKALALSGEHPMTADQAYTIVTQITNTILYLFTTCVLWYFGARNNQPGPGSK